MKSRKITRVALLQNYEGMPEKLLGELDEVRAKGYPMVILAEMDGAATLRSLCEKASSLGLQVGVFTGYMKYDYKHLAEHPEQQMVFAKAALDQDKIGMSGWGCPFNPGFKRRYFNRLRHIAALPGVVQVDLNDEAYLASGCYCEVCKQAYAAEIGGPMPCKPSPKNEDWQDNRWREYLAWRMKRWNAVHREMADVIHAVNPKVRASFQTSPAADLWMNPWHTAVDLAAMAEELDSISTDPYYTFHRRIFDPPEVYLSEWARFLAGIMPEGKQAWMIPQGFSHPTFTRPLGEADGIWSAIVPPACGLNIIAPYTYTLQRCSPVLRSYENCFRLDPYFEKTAPLQYAAVVHGLKSEVFKHPLPMETPHSYDGTRLFPVSESLRHGGVPYGYLPDAKLRHLKILDGFRVVVLPEIACLSEPERAGVGAFIRGGGNAVILGALGSANETGNDSPRSLMAELFDLEAGPSPEGECQFRLTDRNPVADAVQRPSAESARRYMDGTWTPLFALSHCRTAQPPSDAQILGEFLDDDGKPTGKPAILQFERYGGRVVWFAGFPTRRARNPRYDTMAINLAHQLFARMTEWAAVSRPVLRVEDWPPTVPMRTLRPLDPRFMPTFEFFPLVGEDCFLGVVTSYFREPTTFPMVLDVPAGKRVKRVRELIGGADVPFQPDRTGARISVELNFDTPALMFFFEMA